MRAAALAAFVAAVAVTVPSSARAADPVAAPPAPAAPADGSSAAAASVAPRLAVVEAEVRAVERLLGVLRRVRTDLRAGRDDVAPASDEEQVTREGALRGVREVLRYESARAKALAALATATQAHDAPKVAEAAAALEAADTKLADALARLESDAAARKDAEKGGKADAKADAKAESAATKSATKPDAKPDAKSKDKPSDKPSEGATDKPASTAKPAPRRGDPPSSMDLDADADADED